MQQRGDDLRPSLIENRDQTPARSTTGLRLGQRVQCFHGYSRVGLASYRQQPPRRDGQGKPQALGTLRILHARVLPLPTPAFDSLESLLDPSPQAVPADLG